MHLPERPPGARYGAVAAADPHQGFVHLTDLHTDRLVAAVFQRHLDRADRAFAQLDLQRREERS
ncbi:hypothetical protein [Streptomyces globisporus]